MFRLGRCFSAFFLSLSSSGWSNLFLISFDTLHSYASFLDTGRKPEDCPRCRGYNAHCYRSFQEPSCALQAGHHLTRLRGKSLRLEVGITVWKAMCFCIVDNDHATLKKGYLNNTRQEHFFEQK